MVLVLLAVAIWGAVVDRTYRKNGGRGPSRKSKWLFGIAVGLSAAITILSVLIDAETGGSLATLMATSLFALWELGRWRDRRKFPLTLVNHVSLDIPD